MTNIPETTMARPAANQHQKLLNGKLEVGFGGKLPPSGWPHNPATWFWSSTTSTSTSTYYACPSLCQLPFPHDSLRRQMQSVAAATAEFQTSCESPVSVKWCRHWDAGQMLQGGPCWAACWCTPCTKTGLRPLVHSTLAGWTTLINHQQPTGHILNHWLEIWNGQF